jgi:hypothetical protein
MHITPVFDKNGNQVFEIEVDDELQYVNGRVHRGKKHYYKGIGIHYKKHFLPREKITEEYNRYYETGVFYLGESVSKKAFQNKFGIFQEKYQEFFPDFIGTCSGKEGTIVLNSETFKLSSVEVHDVVQYDKENDQSYYIVDYKCERKRYIEDNGNPEKLFQLLKYMIENNWNFLWDKNCIGDISPDGMVSDVADLFVSDNLIHKAGTVYALLYSMCNQSMMKYKQFISHYGMVHLNKKYFVYNTLRLLETFGVNTSEMTQDKNDTQNYRNVVLNYIVNGKNCAYCSCDLFVSNGNYVRDQYIKETTENFTHVDFMTTARDNPQWGPIY